MKRNEFLKYFGIAGTSFLLPGQSVQANFGNDTSRLAFNNVKLKGRVVSDGKGIANVAITDGFFVVYTDSYGNYSFDSYPAAEFVYISVPSGFAFPQIDGITSFYKKIEQRSGVFEAEFELQKLTIDDKKHNFVVWADTQMFSQQDVTLLKTTSVPDLQQLISSYPQDSLFHGIGCGDLVWDKFDLFKGYKQAIKETGIPFFNVIGNHDMDLDARSDEMSSKTFKNEFGPTYYSFNRGAIHYIVLDDVFFIGAGKQYIGYVTENQLKWLEKDLEKLKTGSTVVVSLHIPTNTGVARRNKKEAELGSVVSNREKLYQLLSSFKVHFMSGHTHFNDFWEKGQMMEHNHGTVCGAWWTGPICGDGTPNGYGVYEVDGEDIQWYYKSTGKPKEYQLTIFEKGRSKDFPEEVLVNVWNWDPQWKVEWFQDDVAMGLMTQRVTYDPLAVELYKGPSLPIKHKFVEPTLADHIFSAKPSPGTKRIVVKVTDRFGKIFSDFIAI